MLAAGRSRAFRLRAARRWRTEWVFRPRMLRIARTQFFANQGVGVRPEARQVIGHLLRAKVGCEQVQQHLDAPRGDPGSVGKSKHLLNAHRHYRWTIYFVLDLNAAAAGHFDPLRRLTL